MSRLRYNKIPIWENKQRIEYLTFWRDLWLEGMFALNETPESPITRKPLNQAERITELNRRIPAVREMVRLANIQTLRNWRTFRKDDPPIRLDILEEFWNVHQLRLSPRAPSDVVDEAIGRYQADQRGSWIRTFNPLYWIERLIESLIDKAFNVVALFWWQP